MPSQSGMKLYLCNTLITDVACSYKILDIFLLFWLRMLFLLIMTLGSGKANHTTSTLLAYLYVYVLQSTQWTRYEMEKNWLA